MKNNEAKSKNIQKELPLFPKLDVVFEKHLNLIFYISLGLLILFSILLFDIKISKGGDDSNYLFSAKKFIDGVSFPSFHGTFYSILIGWFIKLFGFHLIFFKFLSLLFLIGHHIFFYFGFRKHLSPFILGSILLITSTCSGILYFGSQTYTEAFYMLLQSILIYLLIQISASLDNSFKHIQQFWKSYLFIGLVLFLMSTTRNVGIAGIISVIAFFVFYRKYIPAFSILTVYTIFIFTFSLYKKFVWQINEIGKMSLLNKMLMKHPYNDTFGKEDFSGIMIRIFENSKIYLSRIFLQEVGLKNIDNNSTSLFIAVVLLIILIIGLIYSFRIKDKTLNIVSLFLGISLAITFFSINQLWSQSRLIIVYLPLLLIVIFWALTYSSKYWKLKILRYIVIALLGFIYIKSFIISIQKSHLHQKELSRNLKGDKYFGFTPDFRNFLTLSEWAAKNTPEDVMIGSRKASMSFIYGNGRYFYPIQKFPMQETSVILKQAETSNKEVYILNDKQLRGIPIQQTLFLKKDLFAIISVNQSVYQLFLINIKNVNNVDSLLEDLNINPIRSLTFFKEKICNKAAKTSAINPEIIFNELKENKVSYLIGANLRIDEKQKTTQKINTIRRYMTAINSKYPGIFSLVKQVGKNDEEPALLFYIDYEKYQ